MIVYTGDESGCRARARAPRRHSAACIRYALEGDASAVDADVVASAIRIDSHGATFRWRWTAEGLDRAVSIPLLGRHQVANVSAALAAVHVLGYSLDAAIAGRRVAAADRASPRVDGDRQAR